jgi:hypothetical protein
MDFLFDLFALVAFMALVGLLVGISLFALCGLWKVAKEEVFK